MTDEERLKYLRWRIKMDESQIEHLKKLVKKYKKEMKKLENP